MSIRLRPFRPKLLLVWAAVALAVLGGSAARAAASSATPPARHYLQAEVSAAPLPAYRPPFYILDPRAIPNAWRSAALPHVASRAKRHSPALIETWYRLRYDAPPSPDGLYLYVPHWQVTGTLAVYADRRLVYAPRSGPEWTSFNLPVWVKLADRGAPAPREILFEIQSQASNGGGLSTVWIGTERDIGWRHLVRYWLQINSVIALSYVDGILGLYALCIWAWRPRETALLYVAAATVFNILWNLQFKTGESALPIPADWFGWMLLVGLRGWIISSYLFALEVIGVRARGLKAGLLVAAAVLILPTMPIAGPVSALASADLSPLLDELTLLGVAVMTVTLWILYARKRSHDALVVCLYSSLWPVVGYHDLLFENYKTSIESMVFTPFTFGLIPFAMVYIMTRRYFLTLKALDGHATQLASKVRERERELEASYARLGEFERRQAVALERQRMMRDMHDGMGSVLTGALAVVERGQLSEVDVARMLRGCVDDLKLTIDAMETVNADLPLLLATLRYRLGPRFEQAGVQLVWQVDAAAGDAQLDAEQALHVMRMVQEIFTNIIKHAHAARVVVRTRRAPEGGLVLTVEDDGVGFDVGGGSPRGSRGLANLRHRAAAIGASISWASKPGHTCCTLAMAPAPDVGPAAGPDTAPDAVPASLAPA